jgi:hypothetical protein
MKNLLKFLFLFSIISGILWACAKEKENTALREMPIVEHVAQTSNTDIIVPIDSMMQEAGIRAGGICQVDVKFEFSSISVNEFASPNDCAIYPGTQEPNVIPALIEGQCYDNYIPLPGGIGADPSSTCIICSTGKAVECEYVITKGDKANCCNQKVNTSYQEPDTEFACQITAVGAGSSYDRVWTNGVGPSMVAAAQNALATVIPGMNPQLQLPNCKPLIDKINAIASTPSSGFNWNNNDLITIPNSPAAPAGIRIHNLVKAGNLSTPWITGNNIGSYVKWTFSLKNDPSVKRVYTMTVAKPGTNPYPGTVFYSKLCQFQ